MQILGQFRVKMALFTIRCAAAVVSRKIPLSGLRRAENAAAAANLHVRRP
jgi:hypothetical protein